MQRIFNYISTITTALFLLAALSCSTTEKVKQEYVESRQKSADASLSRTAVDQFFHQVQPVQKEIEKLYGLAVKLQKLHRHCPAIDTFKEILQQDPDHIEALNGVAVSSDLMGAHKAAAAYYQQALKVNPKLDHIWNNLGYCYFLQNQMDLSIDAYEKAIAINPDLQKYRNNLALVSAKQNQFSGSRDQIKLAQNKMPSPKVPAKTAPKNAVLKKRKIAQQIANIDLEPVQLGALKQFPMVQSSNEIAPNGLRLKQVPPLSDLRATPLVHEDNKSDDRERNTGNRPGVEKIPFNALPPIKFVQNIAEIEWTKISIKAKEPVEMKTLPAISKVTKPISSYQVSLPKISSDRLAITTPPVEKQKVSLKHLRMNTSLKKKWAEISSDRLVITPPPVQNQIGPRKHLQMNTRLKKKRVSRKIGLKRCTMVAKQTSGIQIFGLEVSNGNGIRHLAQTVSTHLRNKGVQVSQITNAAHFQHPRTKLYYLKGLLDKARKLAEIIPGRQDVVEVPAFDHDHVRIKLLLGKDVSSANRLL